MTSREERLLENLLDALDRLYDHQSTVIDIHDLLFATSDALSDTSHFVPLQESLPALTSILRSGASGTVQRDAALIATNRLRQYLAELLPID